MNTAECASLASCMLKTRGNFGLLENVTRTPWIGLTRNYHERCEPEHLSWQWRAKNSPEIQRCNKVCLKKKMCPKKRFFPRLKKGFIYTDVVACEGKKKPLTWSEYFSFLLPDNLSQKPPMATCRKLLEHRRRKCLAPEDYQRCVAGECWPLPTEWYGQGVLHISELALTQPPKKEPEEFQLCPPPDYMISKCLQVKLPECPVPKCVEETPKKRPYSQFKGADTDGSPPTLSLKCLVKYTPELLPHPQHLDKSVKISCRNYGEFKSVECPKQMFNRYMNVDFTSKNLLPIPTTSPEYGPLREVKKGVCGRQTLLRPPSIRNFSTGRPLMLKDYPEFIKPVSTSHLQPGCSAFRSDKLIDRAGMDSELLQKPLSERAADKHHLFAFTEEELLKHELDARKSEEPPEEKQRRLEAQKSKLQLLAEKKKSDPEKKMEGKTGSASEANGASSKRRLFHGLVDLEEVPYQRSRFHSSAIHLARKISERGKGSKKNTVDDGKICSGCPGIRGAELGLDKTKGKCSVLKGGIKGRCKVDRPIGPNDRPNKLSMKCKPHQDSPCMRPRSEPVLVGVPSRFFQTDSIMGRIGKSLERIGIMSYSQNSGDLLDKCCEQLEELEKQIECLKANKDKLKNDRADGQSHDDLLKQCTEKQADLKKQIDELRKPSGSKEQDDCEKKAESSKKREPPKQEDPCKKDGQKQGPNCKQIRDQLQKKKFCIQHMEKENEKLKKEMAALKNSPCEDQAKELKMVESKLKNLIQANEKLVAELKDLRSNQKGSIKDVCKTKKEAQPKKSADKQRVEMDPQMKEAFENCVKKCSEKVFKDKIKKELQKEKKKCNDMLKNKKKNLEDAHATESEDAMGRFINAACDKLQTMAKKAKNKKSNKKC